MKLSNLLSAVSALSAVPTGWAIYAGVTKHPAFPIDTAWAVLGAVGVVSTTAAAGLLVTDIKAHNQALHDTERDIFNMTTRDAWLVIAGCVLAEITLSLLIVVIPGALAFGVLVFPPLTLAGVFSFALRQDLELRERGVAKLRIKIENDRKEAEENHKKDLKEKRELRMSAKSASKSATSPLQVQASALQSDVGASRYPRRCEYCASDVPDSIALLKNSNAVGGHKKARHPELCKQKNLMSNFLEKVQVKQ